MSVVESIDVSAVPSKRTAERIFWLKLREATAWSDWPRSLLKSSAISWMSVLPRRAPGEAHVCAQVEVEVGVGWGCGCGCGRGVWGVLDVDVACG
eukprot:2092996-Prymnesium_polylepis.1